MDYLIAIYTGRKIYTITLKHGASATVGGSQADTIFIEKYSLSPAYISLACDAGGVRLLAKQPMLFGEEQTSHIVLSAGEVISVTDKISLAVFESHCALNASLNLAGFNELRLGRSYNNNDICLKDADVSSRHACLKRTNNRWLISDLKSRNGTFADGELVSPDGEIPAENVNIFICGYIFYIQNDTLRFTNIPGEIEFTPEVVKALVPSPAKQKTYPYFRRSPRIRASAENAQFDISSPPGTGSKPSISWLSILLPPSIMVIAMGCAALFSGNYNMLLYSLPMSLVSVLVTVINNSNAVKKWQNTNSLAIEKYSAYLADLETQITNAEGAFMASASATSPGVLECLAIARNVSRRLWERTPKDKNFLSLRTGTGTRESNVIIKTPHSQMTIEDNEFTKQAQELQSRHAHLTGVTVCVSLLDSPVIGLAGMRDSVVRTAHRLIMDIAAHHSYEDVKIICIYPEEERPQWEWLRWLPHVWDTGRNKRFLACTLDSAKNILREAAENFKDRQRDIKPDREAPPETPFYVVILADRFLAEAAKVQISPDSSAYGFAAVYAYGDTLPVECQSVITCSAPAKIQTTKPDSGTITTAFTPDRVSANILDEFARSLAPVRLISSGKGAGLPANISFLQGFNARTVDDLNVIGRWRKSHSEKSPSRPYRRKRER